MAGQFHKLWQTLAGAVLLAGTLLALPVTAGTQLVMVEEAGCQWCAAWDEKIAPIYPKTSEGRAAPLRRIDLRAPYPIDLTFVSRVRFSPTFVLVVDGQEVGRIEGYPGEDFFWGLLGVMLKEANIDLDTES